MKPIPQLKRYTIGGGLIILMFVAFILFSTKHHQPISKPINKPLPVNEVWQAPDSATITSDENGRLIEYGKDLIIHTAKYLGPKGSIAHISNGMNCGNCHINGGTQLYGNSFAAVAATYPKYRERSGRIENLVFRINDCLLRSLNGQTLDSNSREMKAMIAYIQWIGSKVQKGTTPKGSGTQDLDFLSRAADPQKGSAVYHSYCQSCHGAHGEGVMASDSTQYVYPPLWGANSYNVSAGMYRLTKLAGFVENNMPFGTTYHKPLLSKEDAWDVAAFVNSQPRAVKLFSYDWPKINTKPVDYPFGPYSDSFSEKQHKFGPFGIIKTDKNKKDMMAKAKG